MLQPANLPDGAELRRFGMWLAGGALCGAVLGVLLTTVLTPRWQASAQIRPGQIASSSVVTTVIESPARIAERVNSQAFAAALKARLELPPGDGDPRSRIVDDSLRASVLERAALVSVKVEGFSKDEVLRTAEAALKQLVDAHAPMYRPTVERLSTQLAEIDADVRRIEGERTRLLATITAGNPLDRAGERFSESVLIGNLINIRDSELRTLRDRAASINEALSPERTYPTGPIDRVVVPERAIYPRRSMFVVGGVIVGMMLGAMLALVVRRRR
jgi:uncharacterized protein involved in exopolysaccharide biosynthesis